MRWKPSAVRETVLLYKSLGNNYRNQSLNTLKSHLQNGIMFDKLPSNNLFAKGQTWWHTPVISAPGRQRQKDHKFQSAWSTEWVQVSQSYGSVPELCVLPFCLYKDTWLLIAINRKAFYLEGYLQAQHMCFIRWDISISLKSGSWGLWVPGEIQLTQVKNPSTELRKCWAAQHSVLVHTDRQRPTGRSTWMCMLLWTDQYISNY